MFVAGVYGPRCRRCPHRRVLPNPRSGRRAGPAAHGRAPAAGRARRRSAVRASAGLPGRGEHAVSGTPAPAPTPRPRRGERPGTSSGDRRSSRRTSGSRRGWPGWSTASTGGPYSPRPLGSTSTPGGTCCSSRPNARTPCLRPGHLPAQLEHRRRGRRRAGPGRS
jgi:hypothetical protein